MDVPGNSMLNSKLTSKESLFVSERLRDWRRLLRHLFEETDEDVDHLIEGLEHDQNSQHWNLQEVAARALNKWKQKRSGIDYTFEKLAEALQKIGEKELCKEFLLQRGYRWGKHAFYKARYTLFFYKNKFYKNNEAQNR